MKFTIVLLLALGAMTSAIEIDWSKVRPIEYFDHYWARLPVELQALRRSVPSARIVNGYEAIPGQFPYQVVLMMDFDLGTGVCGATILSNDYILTAAHCVETAHGGRIIVGAHNRSVDEPSQQLIPVVMEDVNIHPGYTLENVRNDIATVRLTSSIVFNDRVQPIRLPSQSDGRTFSGMTGTVSGFGRTTDANSILSEVLRYVYNPILTNADCRDQWSDIMPELIEPQNICFSAFGARSPCHSDSGGPLTVQENGESLQVGIVSFGSGRDCETAIPTVFARVTYYLDWIQENSDIVLV